MFRKKNRGKKRTRAMLSAYSIIMILIILLGILSHVLPRAKYTLATPEDSNSVEVGPGEWEGEASEGGPTELKDGGPEVGDDVSLGESESRMISEGPVPEDQMSNRSVEGGEEAIEVYNKGFEDEEVVVISDVQPEIEEFDSMEACEEKFGEGQCQLVDGSGVVGAELHQVLMAPILGFEDAIDVCIFVRV